MYCDSHKLIDFESVNMYAQKMIVLAAFCLVCCCKSAISYRILGVFPFATRSHYILGNALMKGLAEAGHDVTVISPFEEKDMPKNGSYRNVVLTGFAEDFNKMVSAPNFFANAAQPWFHRVFVTNMLFYLNEATFNHTNVQALLNSEEKFDVVIVEQFFNDPMKVFAHHYQAPLIMFSLVGATAWVNDMVGNPCPLSYIPDVVMPFPPNMIFFQRVQNVLSYVFQRIVYHVLIFMRSEAVVKKYFPDSPDLIDLHYNVSLVLLNSHESLNQAVPLVPNMVEIGGFHIKPPKKLPKDLQEYLDEAKDGVVYFSLGSNLKSKDLPPEKRDMFLRVLSKLKQKVLWKWEDDNLPGQPSNVRVGKWFPQQDILAHPNVKVFISHGGLLSTTETVYHGVPILAIPVFGDQHKNAITAEINGYGLSLPFADKNFTEERLLNSLNELLYNPKYRDNVQKLSRTFHDRSMKPMENAVFWVEYVIRHGGAVHLRVAGIHLPWYKYFLLDVIAFIIGVTTSVLFLLCLGIKLILNRRKAASRTRKVKKN